MNNEKLERRELIKLAKIGLTAVILIEQLIEYNNRKGDEYIGKELLDTIWKEDE